MMTEGPAWSMRSPAFSGEVAFSIPASMVDVVIDGDDAIALGDPADGLLLPASTWPPGPWMHRSVRTGWPCMR